MPLPKSRKMSRRNRRHKSVTSSALPNEPLAKIAEHLPGSLPPSIRVKGIIQHQQHFEGPLPHPDIFRQYGDIIPDAPERILRVFEEDSKHAREIQMAALQAQKADNSRVHWMAYSLISGGFILSAIFAWLDKEVLSGIILTTTLAGTITGFFKDRRSLQGKTGQSKSAPDKK